MKKTEKGLAHVIVTCWDCDYREVDCIAEKVAYEHANKTGHTVNIKTEYTQTLNPK